MLVSCRPHVDVKKLSRNTKVVAEALARVIYNLTEKVNAPNEKIFKHVFYLTCYDPLLFL